MGVLACLVPAGSLAAEKPAVQEVALEQAGPNQALVTLLTSVYQSNPSLQAARQEMKQTEELYPQARAGWLPNATVSTSLFSSNVESGNFSDGDGATTKNASLNINQPVWRGGRTSAEIARSRALIRAGKSLLSSREQALFLDAAIAYMDVLRDRQLLALRVDNEKLLGREYASARERRQIGDLTETDVQQARSRRAAATASRLIAEGQLQASEANFGRIAGYMPPASIDEPSLRFIMPETPAAMQAMAEQNNPDLAIELYEKTAAEAGVKATFRELFPQISAFATLNAERDPQPGLVDRAEDQTVGVRATLLLYDGGVIRSRVRQAKSAVKQQEYEIADVHRRIVADITTNWATWQAARAETIARQTEMQATEEALAGVREETMIGQRTLLDVLDADQERINAKTTYAIARRNEAVARFTLAVSLGLFTPENLGVRP